MRAALRILLALLGGGLALLALLPVAAILLPFWTVAALTAIGRALHRRVQRPAVPWSALIQYEAVIGWRPRPNLDACVEADPVFHLTTDAEGWRGQGSIDAADVVVFGDSFAFGHGIDEERSFAAVASGVRIKAVGVNGYNLVQELLWMERLAPRVAGKLVVWFVYYGNDLYENLQPNLGHYRMPFVRERRDRDGFEIVAQHVTEAPWSASGRRDYYRRLAELCGPTFLAERAYAACGHLLERGRGVCRDAGARLAVIGIPDVTQVDPARAPLLRAVAGHLPGFDPGRPDRELAAICARLDLPFLPLARHLSGADHLPGDVHWNARGHRRVAQLLVELHERTPIHAADPAEVLA